MVRTTVFFLASIIIVSALAITAQGEVGSGPCRTFGNVATTVCGATVDSTYGHGAVELCGDCFPCGVRDGVCPMDFGVNCSACADPDCPMDISGIVFRPDGTTPLRNAEVIAYQAYFDAPFVSITSDEGRYELNDIPRGAYNLRARHDEYPYQEVPLPYMAESPATLDITMSSPTCSDNCMSWTLVGDRCQAICRGEGGCNPLTPRYANDTSPEPGIQIDLLERCDARGAQAGMLVFLGTVSQNEQLWGRCCSGPVFRTSWRRAIEPLTDARDVTKRTIPVTYSGDDYVIPGVKFHIITYKK